MTACMESELQGRFENTAPHLIVQELDALYAKHARTERYEVTHAMWNCKMKEGTPVSEHMIKIMRLGQRLTEMGFPSRNHWVQTLSSCHSHQVSKALFRTI